MKSWSRTRSSAAFRVTRQGSLETVSYPLIQSYAGTFTVTSDYTGPKNTSVAHAHGFVKNEKFDYQGSNFTQSSANNWTLQVGVVESFPGFLPGLTFPIPPQSILANAALSDLNDQIRGNVDWAVSLAEGKQTLRMINDYRDYLTPLADKLAADANRIIRFLRRFHPSQWGRRWLEYQYGIRPIVSDMYKTMAGMEAFARGHKVKVTGRAKDTHQWRDVVTTTGKVYRHSAVTTQRCVMATEFQIPSTRLNSLANYMSVNPISLAWELLPFSFVADWFINVGGFLRNLESACLFAGASGGGYTTHTLRMIAVSSVAINYSAGMTKWEGFARATQVYSSKSRSVGVSTLPSIPLPRMNLGAQRLFSAASLLSLAVTRAR